MPMFDNRELEAQAKETGYLRNVLEKVYRLGIIGILAVI